MDRARTAGAVNTRKHVAYERTYAEYAAAFDCGERSIKSYVKFGKQQIPQDLPPLDRPVEMAAWWARVMKHRVPEKLLQLAAGKSLAASAAQPDLPPAPPPEPRDFSQIQSLDMAENVEELRRALAVDLLLLREAKADPTRASDVPLLRRDYEKSLELLRKAEVSLIEIQKARGNSIDRSSIVADAAQALEMIRLMRRSMPAKIIAELKSHSSRRFMRIVRLLEPHLLAAVERVRDPEEEFFRKMASIRSPEDLQQLIPA